MKTRILMGCGMLLTLGTAMAGTWIYEQGRAPAAADEIVIAAATTQEATPEMIALWKATASSTGYIAPRVPL